MLREVIKDHAQLASLLVKKQSVEHFNKLILSSLIFLPFPIATKLHHLVHFMCINVNMKFEDITTKRKCFS